MGKGRGAKGGRTFRQPAIPLWLRRQLRAGAGTREGKGEESGGGRN